MAECGRRWRSRSAPSRSGVADALQAARERWHKSADLNAVRTDLHRPDPGRGRRRVAGRTVRCSFWPRAARCRTTSGNERAVRAPSCAPRWNLKPPSCRLASTAYADGRPRPARRQRRSLPNTPAAWARAADRPGKGGSAAEPGARGGGTRAWFPCLKASEPLPSGRMLRLAAAASRSAALSARLELYPRGMAPLTALRLSLGALAGPDRLPEDRPPRPRAGPLPRGRGASRPAGTRCTARRGRRRPRMARPRPMTCAGYYSRTVSDTGSGTLAVLRYPTTAPRARADAGGARCAGAGGEDRPCRPHRRLPGARPSSRAGPPTPRPNCCAAFRAKSSAWNA